MTSLRLMTNDGNLFRHSSSVIRHSSQAFFAASRYTSSGGLFSSIVDSSTTTLSTLEVLGSSNIVSISDCSRIERRPRAPVLRASALRAIALKTSQGWS